MIPPISPIRYDSTNASCPHSPEKKIFSLKNRGKEWAKDNLEPLVNDYLPINQNQTKFSDHDQIELSDQDETESFLSEDSATSNIDESKIRQINRFNNSYEKYELGLNHFIYLKEAILFIFDYTQANKNNFYTIFNKNKDNHPKKEENTPATYKTIDSILDIIVSQYKLYSDAQFKFRFDKLPQTLLGYEHLLIELTNTKEQNKVKKIREWINLFNDKFKYNKEKTIEELYKNITSFSIDMLALTLVYTQKTTAKTAKILKKSTISMFKNIYAIYKFNDLIALQKKSNFDVKTHHHVKIITDGSHREREYWIQIEKKQEKLNQDVIALINHLDHSQTIEEVNAALKDFFPFTTFEEFQKIWAIPIFKREIIQIYYQHLNERLLMSPTDIKNSIRYKKFDYHSKITDALSIIYKKIDDCQDCILPFEKIQHYFAQLHLDIQSISITQKNGTLLNISPKNEKEWKEAIDNEAYVKALAKQWVDFQQTTGLLAMQALQQGLQSKIEVEKECLFQFQFLTSTLKLITSVLQLSLLLPKIQSTLLGRSAEIFFTKTDKLIPILGLFHITFPLFSVVTSTIENIFIQTFNHFFAMKYKPNEHSFKGIQNIAWINFNKIMKLIYYWKNSLHTSLLWLNIKLVENCIQKLKKNKKKQDSRFIRLEKHFKSEEKKQRDIQCHLEKKFKQLKTDDANLFFFSSTQQTSSAHHTLTPIQFIAKMINEVDVSYFPPQVLNFFEKNLEFHLTENSKSELEPHLNDYFSRNYETFFRGHSDYLKNRYLKV
ncbi:MAG: hypothetical protein ACH350_06935 [Parachlamydiaceae bacterium]